MLNKIKRFFYNILYSLPFGMKAADEMLSTQTINDDVGVVETIRQNRLSEGLIKGEVTQQVEELRYRDYKVYRESKKYKYLGDGIAIKKDIKECVGKINFIQNNKFITNTILDELKRVGNDEYGKEDYTLKIKYDNTVRFPLEKYCKYFSFNANNDSYDNTCDVSLYFDVNINSNNTNSFHFLKYLKNSNDFNKCLDYKDNIKEISFVTYKSNNEDDFIEYKCTNIVDGVIDGNLDNEYIITLKCLNFERIDLTDKFYCKEMEQKYENKEKKENNFTFGSIRRITTCDECGKEISNYDADITRGSFGFSMCNECLERYLEREFK